MAGVKDFFLFFFIFFFGGGGVGFTEHYILKNSIPFGCALN